MWMCFKKTITKRKVLKNVPLKIKCIILDKLNKSEPGVSLFLLHISKVWTNFMTINLYISSELNSVFLPLLCPTPTFPPDQYEK